MIEEIDENCSGYEGETKDTEVQAYDTEHGVRLGLFFPIAMFDDKQNCPYFRQHGS